MAYHNIVLESVEPGIYVLTVNRPQALNALNAATLTELVSAVERVEADGNARALLVTGAGDKAFVAGADIRAMQSMTPVDAQVFSELGSDLMRAIENLPVPAVALVNGYALGGGCELAMACDWIIASETAVFGQPEVNLGIPPGFGGTQRLSRRLGAALALELIITGRQINAEEAHRVGLVNSVVPAAELMAKGLETGRVIASKAPLAVRVAKQAVRRGLDVDVANGCMIESSLFAFSFSTADHVEGMAAFLEKRAPHFKGN